MEKPKVKKEEAQERVHDILGDAIQECMRPARRASSEDARLISRIMLFHSDWLQMQTLHLRETLLDPVAKRRYH